MKIWPFTWIIQRITAILLIIAAPIKLFTGYVITIKLTFISYRTALKWHTHPVLDSILIFGTSFHVFYGLRTILIDLGVKKEKFLFWFLTICSIIFSFSILYLVYFGG